MRSRLRRTTTSTPSRSAPAHLRAQGSERVQAGGCEDRCGAQRGRHCLGHRARRRRLHLPRWLPWRHRRGAAVIRDHVGIPSRSQSRRSTNACVTRESATSVHRRGRLHSVLSRHGEGDRTGRRRRSHRLGGADRARLPSVPELSHRFVLVGDHDAEAGADTPHRSRMGAPSG